MRLGDDILLPLLKITYSSFFCVYKLEERLEPDMEIYSYCVSWFLHPKPQIDPSLTQLVQLKENQNSTHRSDTSINCLINFHLMMKHADSETEMARSYQNMSIRFHTAFPIRMELQPS